MTPEQIEQLQTKGICSFFIRNISKICGENEKYWSVIWQIPTHTCTYINKHSAVCTKIHYVHMYMSFIRVPKNQRVPYSEWTTETISLQKCSTNNYKLSCIMSSSCEHWKSIILHHKIFLYLNKLTVQLLYT